MDIIPNDYEAEQAILGSIIYDNDKINDVIGILQPNYFYDIPNQHIYRAMLELDSQKQPIDELLLGDQLKSQSLLEDSGGYSYLATLQDCIPGSGNLVQYARIVEEHALLRQLIDITHNISRKSRDRDANISELLVEADRKISEISVRTGGDTFKHIKDIVKDRMCEYEHMTDPDYDKNWNPTGFIDLDRRITGLKSPDLIVVAGRPSMGKTALALNIAEKSNSVSKFKGAVVVFSYEMSISQIGDRAITTRAKVNYNDIINNKLEQHDYDNISEAVGKLSEMNIYVIDKPVPVEKMSHELKKIEKIHGSISLVIADYMQIIPVLEKLPREQQISKISRTMKIIAKEFDTPVMALAQLNRKLEERGNKRPMMSDLRESGAIEQDADIIMFVYRDEVYNPETVDQGVAEIIIGKQRNGPVGTVRLRFQEKYTRFDNLSER